MNWLQNGAGLVFTLAQEKKVEASFFMKMVEQSIWIGIGACALLGLFCGYLSVPQNQTKIVSRCRKPNRHF